MGAGRLKAEEQFSQLLRGINFMLNSGITVFFRNVSISVLTHVRFGHFEKLAWSKLISTESEEAGILCSVTICAEGFSMFS